MTRSSTATTVISAIAFLFASSATEVYSFLTPLAQERRPRAARKHGSRSSRSALTVRSTKATEEDDVVMPSTTGLFDAVRTRRSVLQQGLIIAAAASASNDVANFLSNNVSNDVANAAVGTLPEYSDTNAILQGLSIDVTDKKQYDETIDFFVNGFEGCKVLIEWGGSGGGVVKETVSC